MILHVNYSIKDKENIDNVYTINKINI